MSIFDFEKIIEKMMGKMTPEEKEKMMEKMMEKFFGNISKEEKQKIMEKMMSKMMESMDMSEMMSKMMTKMMEAKSGMPSMMMQMMKNMMGGEKEGAKKEHPPMPGMEKREDFKPWECCPCRKLCEEGFKNKPKEEKKDDEGKFKQ